MLILAVAIFVVSAYVIGAPDRRTYVATRGTAGAVRSAWSAGADRYRTLRPDPADPVPEEGSAPRKKGGPRKRPGSKGTGPGKGSARTLGTRVRAAVRSGVRGAVLGVRVLAAAARAVRSGYRTAAEKAHQKRYGSSPTVGDEFPEEPLLNQHQPTTDEGEQVNIDVDTDSAVGEYLRPDQIRGDNEILEQLSTALIAAQEAFDQHVTGMVGKYEGCGFETDALTEAFSSLSEVGETGWSAALELVPTIDDAIDEAAAIGQQGWQAGAKGDVESFAAS